MSTFTSPWSEDLSKQPSSASPFQSLQALVQSNEVPLDAELNHNMQRQEIARQYGDFQAQKPLPRRQLAPLDAQEITLASEMHLPTEVLCQIFLYASRASELDLDHSHSSLDVSQCPWLLTYVCQRWRQIVLGFPTLWTAVSVPLYPPLKLSKGFLLGMQLTRSCDLALHVTLDCGYQHIDTSHPFFASLLPTTPRWRCLHLGNPKPIISDIQSMQLGHVTSLSVDCFATNDISDFLLVLQRMHTMETLALRSVQFFSQPTEMPPPQAVVLARLESLTLLADPSLTICTTDSSYYRFLYVITAPKLRHLETVLVSGNCISRFLSRSGCRLESFGVQARSAGNNPLWSSFSSTTTLSITTSTPGTLQDSILRRLTMRLDDQMAGQLRQCVFVPRLQTLSIFPYDVDISRKESADCLTTLLLSRVKATEVADALKSVACHFSLESYDEENKAKLEQCRALGMSIQSFPPVVS